VACKQQLQLRCPELRSPSYFNKPLHVLLLALLRFVNLNLSSNRAFCVSAVRERLQLMYRSWITNKFKQWDNLSRSIKIEVSAQQFRKWSKILSKLVFYSILCYYGTWYLCSNYDLNSIFRVLLATLLTNQLTDTFHCWRVKLHL
jgi:hypothetical protein